MGILNTFFIWSLAVARLFVFYRDLCSELRFSLSTVHSCVVYRRLRHSARSTRTRWTSLQNKRYLTVYSSFTVYNGHLNMLEIIWSLAIARLFVFSLAFPKIGEGGLFAKQMVDEDEDVDLLGFI